MCSLDLRGHVHGRIPAIPTHDLARSSPPMEKANLQRSEYGPSRSYTIATERAFRYVGLPERLRAGIGLRTPKFRYEKAGGPSSHAPARPLCTPLNSGPGSCTWPADRVIFEIGVKLRPSFRTMAPRHHPRHLSWRCGLWIAPGGAVKVAWQSSRTKIEQRPS